MDSVMELIIQHGELVAALAVILGASVPVYRLVQKLHLAVGEDSTGRSLSERMDRVEYQLWENGGDSLKDRVNSLDIRTTSMDNKLDLIQEIVVAGFTPAKKTKIVRSVK